MAAKPGLAGLERNPEMNPRRRLVWAFVVGAVWLGSAGLAGAQKHVQRNKTGELALKAMREYNWKHKEFVDALPLEPGDTVVIFGMSSANYLKEFLRRVGPEGKVHAVFRMESNYLHEIGSGISLEDSRIEPVFAADGDAHIEEGVADLVVAMDLFGFYRREDALYRQAYQLLKPGGELIQVRARRRTQAEYEQVHGSAPSELKGRQLAQETNRQRLGVTQHGFEYVEEISLFETRTIRVFRTLRAGSEEGL
jgi:SAM-dependent methyltransferase